MREYIRITLSSMDPDYKDQGVDRDDPQAIIDRVRHELSYKQFYRKWSEQHHDAAQKNDMTCVNQEDDPVKSWVRNLREFIRNGYPDST